LQKIGIFVESLEKVTNYTARTQIFFSEILWKLPEKSAVFSWDSGLHKNFFDFHLQFCA